MKNEFQVEIKDLRIISDYPQGWLSADYRTLLRDMDFDEVEEISEDELADFTILALQDLKFEEAASFVLNNKLGSRLTQGQIQNLSEEIQDEPLWEEYPDISFHRELFICGVLLNQAFPGLLPKPEAIKLTLEITGNDGACYNYLLQPSAGLLVRLLADGMPDSSVLRRLFRERLDSNFFPEAKDILWNMENIKSDRSQFSVQLAIYSSLYWVKSLADTTNYVSHAHSDKLQSA